MTGRNGGLSADQGITGLPIREWGGEFITWTFDYSKLDLGERTSELKMLLQMWSSWNSWVVSFTLAAF